VLGRPLDDAFGTSLKVIQRLLRSKDPMLPNFGFPTVDVEDVALMHVRALERSGAIGQRYAGGDEFIWFPQMAAILKQAFPERRIVTAKAPDFVIRLLGLFDAEIATIVNQLGQRDDISADKARKELGITFKPAPQAVREAGRFLIETASI
jgi:dihydroflavonol-4-reductase